MYLNNADSLEELTIYGIDPTLALMDLFEDKIQEILIPGSLEFILFTEIKGKTLVMQERARDIIQVHMDKKNSQALRMKKILKELEELIRIEDKKMDDMKKTAHPSKVDEKFCYVLGLAKALSMITE